MDKDYKVSVGDRVSWFGQPTIIGTIKSISLHLFPFYVVWDNGKDDWYTGDQLRKVKND